ncbi:uncharacterized protein LOC121860294 [Homarus americanus]|uniref:uncharacterized protein LOC121860294 n=1 Tax=Homarus americanus TaxID=6706 RepID=UPI001C43DE0B|nr:uncharacterized protein LOC121860294 [Homarus americanus]
MLTLEVNATLTDAYWNDNNATVGVALQIESGSTIPVVVKVASLQVVRENITANLPRLNHSLTLNDTFIYSPLDVVEVIFSLSQLEDSLVEPSQVTLVMFLPVGGYLTFTSHQVEGLQPTITHDSAKLSLSYGLVRFTDVSRVSAELCRQPRKKSTLRFSLYQITVP